MQLTISAPSNVFINNNFIFLTKLQVDIEEAAKRTSFIYTISESHRKKEIVTFLFKSRKTFIITLTDRQEDAFHDIPAYLLQKASQVGHLAPPMGNFSVLWIWPDL